MEGYGHGCITTHKAGLNPLYLADDFYKTKALHDLFPQHPKLHLGQSVTHAAMQTKPKGQMVARIWPVYPKTVRIWYHSLVAIARDIPHGDLVASAHLLTAKFQIPGHRSAHKC